MKKNLLIIGGVFLTQLLCAQKLYTTQPDSVNSYKFTSATDSSLNERMFLAKDTKGREIQSGYAWDADQAKWFLKEKKTFVGNEFPDMAKAYSYKSLIGKQESSANSFPYDYLEEYEFTIDGDSTGVRKYEHKKDANSRDTALYAYRWAGEWTDSLCIRTTYGAYGATLQKEYLLGTLNKTVRNYYSNLGVLDSTITENISDTTKEVFSYNSRGSVSQLYTSSDGVWEKSGSISKQNIGNDTIINYSLQSMFGLINYKITQSYENGNLTKMLMGMEIIIMGKVLQSQDMAKMQFEYNANNKLTNMEVYSWSKESNQWNGQMKYMTGYNANKQFTDITIYAYDTTKNTWIPTNANKFVYNANSDVKQTFEYVLNSDSTALIIDNKAFVFYHGENPYKQTETSLFLVSENNVKLSSAASAKASVSIYADKSWTASSSAAWLTVSPTSATATDVLKLTASENTTGAVRTATVTVTCNGVSKTIAVSQAVPPVTTALTVDKKEITVAAGGATETVTVTSNADWTAVSSEPWATATYSKTTGQNGKIVITVAKSTEDARTATITVSTIDSTKTITINQASGSSSSNDDITASEPIVTFSSAANTKKVTVYSNTDWSANSSASWLTVSQTGSTGNGSVTLSATENSSTTERTATVTLTAGTATFEISVTQGASGTTETFILSETSLTFESNGDTKASEITSSSEWTIGTVPSWLTTGKTTTVGHNGIVTFTAGKNSSGATRTASITITSAGVTKSISISQPASSTPDAISFDKESVTMTSENSTTTITVTSNSNWTVTSQQTWIQATAQNSTGNGTITLTVLPNTTGVSRTGTVSVTANGETHNITVTQAAANTSDVESTTENAIVVYPNPTAEQITISASESARVEIRSVATGELLLSVVNANAPIQVAHLPNGEYNVVIVSETKNTTKKLIISR